MPSRTSSPLKQAVANANPGITDSVIPTDNHTSRINTQANHALAPAPVIAESCSNQDIRTPPQLLTGQSRFALAKTTIAIQFSSNPQEIDNHYTRDNPYYYPAATLEQKKQLIYNDFVLLTLLKNFLPKEIQRSGLTEDMVKEAYVKTYTYLSHNGANSFLLTDTLNHLFKNAQFNTILNDLHSNNFSPYQYAQSLNNNIDHNNQPIIDNTVPDLHKIPAELSGLLHSLFKAANGNWYAAIPHFDLTVAHDTNIMQLLPKEFLSSLSTPKFGPEANPAHRSALIDEGSTTKVIHAYDLANPAMLALKKFKDYNLYLTEMQSYQSSTYLIPERFQHHFCLPVTTFMGRGKKGILNNSQSIKSSVLFPLLPDQNEYSKALYRLMSREQQAPSTFEENAYKHIKCLVEKTNILDEMGVILTDFKSQNIVNGQIIDFAHMAPAELPFSIDSTAHTQPYTMPHLLRKNLTLEELKTSNRYNLGTMILHQMLGVTPLHSQLHPLLRLPEHTEFNKYKKISNPVHGYALSGYPNETLNDVPDSPHDGHPTIYTKFEKELLRFAKQLMAEDRSKASAENLNTDKELEEIGKLRLSQTSD